MPENQKSTKASYFYLSRGQLLILAIAFVLASTIFFFLGILIGQRIEERKLLHRQEPAVKMPLKPDLEGKEEEMTFYDTLTDAARLEAQAPPGARGDGTLDRHVKAAASDPGAPSWSVQVTAFQNEDDATQMASELDGEGYSAFVVSGQVKGKTWHRVRVGRYPSREAAMTALQKLKNVDRYRNAIITRDN